MSLDLDEYHLCLNNKPIQCLKVPDNTSSNTQIGVRSSSTRAKEEEEEFNLSFDEDIFLDL